MIPPTYHARCLEALRGRPGSFSVLLRGLGPNRFLGRRREVEQLLRDFVCLDGVQWESHDVAAQVRGLNGEQLSVPYRLVSAHTRDVTAEEAQAVVEELLPIYRHLGAASPFAAEQAEALACVMTASVDEYPLAPFGLMPPTRDVPAWLWAFRVVNFVVEPAPHRALLDFRKKEWWFSWA